MTHLWPHLHVIGTMCNMLSRCQYILYSGIKQGRSSGSGYRAALLLIWLSVLAGCAGSPPEAPAPIAPKITGQPNQEPVRFIHPLPGARVSASFARYIVKSRNRQHHGVDFAAPSGTPVFAASAGVVLSADNTSLSEAFGNAVLIEHGDQLTSLSAHLSRLDVKLGEWVNAGQQIGLVGQTGRATGPHLHFEVWRGSVPQDPITLIPLSPQERQQAMAEMQRQAAASKPSVSHNRQTVVKQTSKETKTRRKITAQNKAVTKTAATKKHDVNKVKPHKNTAAKTKPVSVAMSGKSVTKEAAPNTSAGQAPAKATKAKSSSGTRQTKTADAG